MDTVARSAWVMHSTEEMYTLVNEVESYALFLPWCGASRVLERGDREMIAQVQIAFRGVKKSFTTRNRLTPFESIAMELLDGPFSALSGTWKFQPLQPGACKISLDLRFGFSNAVVGKVVGPVFKTIADSLVESFVKRADELYAKPAKPRAQRPA